MLASPSFKPVVRLECTTIEVVADDLLMKTVIRQTYRNTAGTAMEVDFDIPLAWRTVMTHLWVEVGDERLEAKAYAREEAEERYEDAVESGDLPVRIQCGNGLASLSIGNLRPDETIVLEMHLAQTVEVMNGRARLRVPTSIGMRYRSDAMRGSFEEAPEITASLFADHDARARFTLKGVLAEGRLSSPSHSAAVQMRKDEILLTIDEAKLDRDIVVVADDLPRLPVRAVVVPGLDGDLWGCFASGGLRGELADHEAPLDLALLIDCSGSMRGRSIAEARKGIEGVLAALRGSDAVEGWRFGSETRVWFTRTTKAALRRQFAKAQIQPIEADLGGTELASALQTASQSLRTSRRAQARSAILLVTDGAVWDIERILEAVDPSIPVAVVGVGLTPGDEALGRIAERSGGWCQFVQPAEPIADILERTVESLRSLTMSTRATVECSPAPDAFETPALALDHIRHWAWAHWNSADAAADAFFTAKGEVFPCERREDEALMKLAAYRRIQALAQDADAARSIALRYGLLTEETDFLMVSERSEAEKTDGLPGYIHLPQMFEPVCSPAPELTDVRLFCAPMPQGEILPAALPDFGAEGDADAVESPEDWIDAVERALEDEDRGALFDLFAALPEPLRPALEDLLKALQTDRPQVDAADLVECFAAWLKGRMMECKSERTAFVCESSLRAKAYPVFRTICPQPRSDNWNLPV